MPRRETDEQAHHDHVVKVLHREYYRYPNAEQRHLMTFANHPFKTKAVRDIEGREYFPDIVVLQAGTERVVMVGEVETESTVDEQELEEWARFSRLGERFYL